MEAKCCTHCGEVKPLDEFHRESKGKYGRNSVCKKCRSRAKPKPPVPEGFKRCTKCNEILPATLEFFKKESRRKSGLAGRCKKCAALYSKEYYHAHIEEGRAYRIQRHYANRDKELERLRLRYQANKAEHRAKAKQWYEANRDYVREMEKQRYLANREVYIEKSRQWRRQNHEKYRAYNQQWFENNPEKAAAIRKSIDIRRRARKRSLPNTFTPKEWSACLEYWENQCAICGANGSQGLDADHWIPLTHPDCPGTVVNNILCLCEHCNSTKHARDPLKWLIEKLGEVSAMQKFEEIHTYFEYVKSLKQEE
jgi:hypothetical protein